MSNRSGLMNLSGGILFTIVAILAIVTSACAGDRGTVATTEEESGIRLALDESYDAVRSGGRLVLECGAPGNSFNGFVENTTDYTLEQVRVEVHLSNGEELGPTTPTDLKPGESIDVSLAATDEGFDSWTAHPETGESGGREHADGEGDD